MDSSWRVAPSPEINDEPENTIFFWLSLVNMCPPQLKSINMSATHHKSTHAHTQECCEFFYIHGIFFCVCVPAYMWPYVMKTVYVEFISIHFCPKYSFVVVLLGRPSINGHHNILWHFATKTDLAGRQQWPKWIITVTQYVSAPKGLLLFRSSKICLHVFLSPHSCNTFLGVSRGW